MAQFAKLPPVSTRRAPHRALAPVAVILLLLAVYGFGVDFAPAAGWFQVATAISFLLTAAIMAVLRMAESPVDRTVLRRAPVARRVLRILALTAAAFAISWMAAVYGSGAALARLTGEVTVREVPFELAVTPSSRSCHQRMRIEGLSAAFTLRFCLTPAQYQKLEGRRTVVLTGWRSAQGFLVEDWHLP